MHRPTRAYDGGGALLLGQSMAKNDLDRHSLRQTNQTRWLSWLTLLAGAVMCVFAVLMS
jgi:hypothetical protein